MLTMNGALFTKTYLPLREVVQAVCKQLMGNPEDAEDVAQDTFLKLWEEREKLEAVECPKAFVIRVARNLCLDRLKSPAKRYRSDIDPMEAGAVADASFDPYHRLVAKEQTETLRRWAQSLAEPKRSIFLLRHYEMLSNQETADRLGLQETTVRSTLSRLRKEARELLLQE